MVGMLAVSLSSCAKARPTGSPPGTVPTNGAVATTVPATTVPATTVPASTTSGPTTAPASTTSGPTTAPATTAPPTNAPATTTPATTAPATATTTLPPPTSTLSIGSKGPAVAALQSRLSSLGYWLGAVDGNFGDATQQAVYALQKASGLARDGVVGPATSAALAAGTVPHPRSTSGYVIEIDLRSNLLMMVRDGALSYVLNTSTGGGYSYTSEGVTSVAVTPAGHFRIYRQVDGLDISPLGELWRPKYFYSGYAIHGYASVPPVPVSHGCVRVSNAAINWIWAEGLAPIGTAVWIY